MTIALRPYQLELDGLVQAAWTAGHRNVVMVLPTGGGKCLGKGTPVLMFDGSIRAVETIRAGEFLMGPDSWPRKVLSTCQGEEELYRVTPAKGAPYVVNESHILSLKTTRQKTTHGPDEIVNISVREYVKKSKWWKHTHKGWRSSEISFPRTTSLPIDPYIFGIWLGDGHSRECAVTTMDDEIATAWSGYGASLGLNTSVRKAGGRSITLGLGKTKGVPNPLTGALRSVGVWGRKHIPQIFRTASVQDRLSLLAGLMDTDGSYTGKGYDFISKSKALAEDVAFVARSLGMAAYPVACMKSAQTGGPREFWRVNISGDVDRIPCRIPHKKARSRKQIKSVLKTGITVEPIGYGEYFGFEIDGDSLFLLGDFTVTHNTRILAAIVERHVGASCVIAHRSEIVGQLSLALAECGVRHNLIASKRDKEAIAALHVKAFGRSFFDPNSQCAVASVDTLIRKKDLAKWAASVTLWVTDEGHHLVLDNKWFKAISQFTHPLVRGLLPTASPKRADGQGLGREEIGGNGVADVMVEGPPLRWLIDEGYLCEYQVICADSHIEELLGEVGASGDWSTAQRRAAEDQSPIVGNSVETYHQLNSGMIRGAPPAPNGRTGVLFASDVEKAGEFLREFRRRGARAELVTGETDPGVRRRVFQRLETREIELVICVDIVSEGTDIPALELGIFCRATASLAVYIQQFGRVLRPLMTPQYKAARTREERLAAIAASPKPLAYIIDHVGNFTRHGPPDRVREWSLVSTRGKRGPSDGVAYRNCLNVAPPDICGQPFERFRTCCPYCGWEPPPPAGRSSPAMVEGDMVLLDPEVLAALRGEAQAAVMSVADYRAKLAATGLPQHFIWANAKSHHVKVEAQMALRDVMATWGGYRRADGLTDREMQRLFYERFGVDVLTAAGLGQKDALALMEKILFDGFVKSL